MISFEETVEQQKLRENVRELAKRLILPKTKKMEEENKFPPEVVTELKKFLRFWIPKEYGGEGASTIDVCIIAEEIGYAFGACLTILEVGGLGCLPIVYGGTDEQKRKYLPPIAAGEAFYSFALTDEGSGSDAVGMKLKAERKGNEYILNGKKRLISNCDIANYILTFGKTDPQKGSRGISAFMVKKDSDGITFSELEGYGIRGHKVYDIAFENCRVPSEDLIGKEGEGFKYAMMGLDRTRLVLAAGNVGIARAALDFAIKFAKERETFGKKIYEYQAMSFPIAEIATEIEAARLLAYKAAWLDDKGVRHTKETSMAKLYGTELAVKACQVAMKVLGGYGWSKTSPVARQFLDAFTFTYAQGTSEIQKLILTRYLFG